MNTVAALNGGGRQLTRFRKLIALFYFVNLVFAAVVVAPVAMLLNTRIGHSLDSDRLFSNLDPSFVSETLYQYQYWPAAWFGITLAISAILYFLLNTFLAGGALAVFRREDDAFFSGCARYFWRLFRLMLISLACYGIVIALSRGVGSALSHASESSMQARPWIILHWVQLLVQFFLFGVLNMIFDYGKIVLVAGERRSAFRAALDGSRFVTRHSGRTLAVYWTCAAIGLLFLLAYHGLSEAIGQGSPFAVLLLFGIRQLYMLARMWVRLWTWSSELRLYTFNSTMVAPVPPSLAVAG